MKVKSITHLISTNNEELSKNYKLMESDIISSIKKTVWPHNSKKFIIYPESGKKRGEGNGVKLIKTTFIKNLIRLNWDTEVSVEIIPNKRFGRFDAYKEIENYKGVLEWETGNISSTHRSINKMTLALLKNKINAGFLVLPSRDLYKFLTDRIGNFQEVEPYFDFWRSIPIKNGFLTVIEVEHDSTSKEVPRIPKGTDGRSLG